jgi:oligosaccharyltransferase complex subunit beta
MRSFFLGLFLALLSFVSALSAVGGKLLVVVDDEADKGKYSTFWSDLQCKSFTTMPQCPMHRTPN